jgi:hypothetical protein
MGFAMNFYMMQEFLGMLIVLAALTGTILAFGIGFILLQEGARRAVHGTKTRLTSLRGLNSKQQWQQAHGRSVLR